MDSAFTASVIHDSADTRDALQRGRNSCSYWRTVKLLHFCQAYSLLLVTWDSSLHTMLAQNAPWSISQCILGWHLLKGGASCNQRQAAGSLEGCLQPSKLSGFTVHQWAKLYFLLLFPYLFEGCPWYPPICSIPLGVLTVVKLQKTQKGATKILLNWGTSCTRKGCSIWCPSAQKEGTCGGTWLRHQIMNGMDRLAQPQGQGASTITSWQVGG